jgi:hypothetical protein
VQQIASVFMYCARSKAAEPNCAVLVHALEAERFEPDSRAQI